jgi:cation transport ATPase
MSIMVGVGRGAQMGVLIKNAGAIELMEKVTTLVVDKTGTLTEGKPRVTKIIAASWISEDDVLVTAATAERQSEHPLASAILARAKALFPEQLPASHQPLVAVSNCHGCAGKDPCWPASVPAREWSLRLQLWRNKPGPSGGMPDCDLRYD